MTETFGVDEAAHDAARTVILDAAAEVFQSQGFNGTTIDDIARRIGATKGRVYYYFRSKFDIYLSVYEYGMRLVREAVEPHVDGPGSGRDRLTAMSVAHAVNLMTNLSYHDTIHQGIHRRSALALKARQTEQLAELNTLRESYEIMFRQVVEEGMADGSLLQEEPKLVARALLSGLNSIDSWFRTRPDQSLGEVEELAARVAGLYIGGLAAR
ncbi:TetR/AcrR family transcriptional regulator [Dietzia natronolimnaea]|uniref:TetR/AcrR family transcriptional regulator n=1 Tax=Dietzia natronolimnaea TaxID=161920 RepID=UPI0015FDE431|nr:TetR/AcrR family transcriptional regulator [Dietzia natronolimnaea]MBB1036880.1 TetR/AcrR family transcriptional regulator [Dietzia natronolimnaea]